MREWFLYQGKIRLGAWLVVMAVGVGLGFLWFRPDGRLHLIACDVGQGDAILVILGNNQVLIDGGRDERVLECLGRHIPFWDRTLELVVMTHADADHIGGLAEVIEDYQVESVVGNNLAKDTRIFWQLREVILKKNIAVYAPEQGDVIRVADDARSGFNLAVWWPEEKLGSALVWSQEKNRQKVLGASSVAGDANAASVVMKLGFGDFEVLLTGDITSVEEQALVDAGIGPVEVLKVAHHGSRYSSSEVLLRAVEPKLALISVGRNNYGHPAPEVLERLRAVGAKILRTDEEGDVEVVSDGQRYWLKQ